MLVFDWLFPCDYPDPRVWCDILSFEVDRKVYFNNIYDCMLSKNQCDLIWKIMHGAIPIEVDFYTGVNIRILLIVTIVANRTIELIFLLHAVDFQGYFS